MLRCLSADINVPRSEQFSESVALDKYTSVFSPQMEVIVFIIQIVFATCRFLKIGEYSWVFPSFSWGIFGHVMCLDQSRASENV